MTLATMGNLGAIYNDAESVSLVPRQDPKDLEDAFGIVSAEADPPLPNTQSPFRRLYALQPPDVPLPGLSQAHHSIDNPFLNRRIEPPRSR